MDVPKVNLVLNINTPSFFEKSSVAKRPLETAFASISTKKTRLSKPFGKAIRPSSKVHKLKINSSLQKLNSYRTPSAVGQTESVTEISHNSHQSKFLNKSKEHISKQQNEKSKVSFNPQIEVFPLNNSSNASDVQNKLLKPDYIYNNSINRNSETKSKNLPGKPIIASLFKNNPDIPVLEKSDAKPSELNIFSNTPFRSLSISSKLIDTVEKLGFTNMTQVQEYGIPAILDGRDTLIKSQTGSGKTLSYALPIIHTLMMKEPKIERSQGLFALIIVPTRELAVQSYQWFEKLCKTCVCIVPGYLIGGEKKKSEKARIRKGINILVATPGRLMDHIDNTNSLELNNVQYLILDEADRMLDMGYEKSIKSILFSLNQVQKECRQTVLLSATLTNAVEKLAGMTLTSPKIVDVTVEQNTSENSPAFRDDHLVTPQNLSHHFMLVPMKVRLVSLAAFVIEKCKFSDERKMLIFMTTQDMVDYHSSLFAKVISRIGRKVNVKERNTIEKRAQKVLSGESDDEGDDDEDDDEEIDVDHENDIHFMKLHGNMSQPERTAVFKSFNKATSGVLLCTDVASRGLDLPRVNWIVQYNPACSPADYVHRVGRTARANMTGSAVMFVNPAESTFISLLKDQGIKFNEIRMENTLKILVHPSLYVQDVEKVPHRMEIAATRMQDKFENAVEKDSDMRHLAEQGYVSFIRSYAAIPKALREYFCFKLLHLGHCAKCFALRDPPSVLGSKSAKSFHNKGDRPEKRKRHERRSEEEQTLLPIKKMISEFDSGLEYLDDVGHSKKQSKKKRKYF